MKYNKITLDTPWQDIIDSIDNEVIVKAFLKANSVLNSYSRPCCSISGGKDSDIVLDIIWRVDKDKKMRYVWFDTGLEYQATKDHLDYLENKYGITIEREKAIKPIPIACKEYGQPFLSKMVSEMMCRLQKHNFKWEDKSFEELYKKYPKCKGALTWWTNNRNTGNFANSIFNISYNKYLKEFILLNPPQFAISAKCCDYAKKNVKEEYIKSNNLDLNIVGIRRAEGGARSAKYKNCYDNNKSIGKYSNYRPLFYFKNDDVKYYSELFNIVHSDCYTTYKFKRTGCVGCPYNRELKTDIKIINKYEPKLSIGINNIFKDSYEYTAMYRKFVEEQKKLNK